mmetsp:Transcript_21243/g.23740  ORF Transcript_21243/g.23740 Transcript_21243/m.23740 type:complete len:410 (-) Transcript_21243:24-1253(-)
MQKEPSTKETSNGPLSTLYKWLTATDYPVYALVLLLLAELAFSLLIITKVPYTEIDWRAYMEEVEGVDQGQYDYTELKGGTGPLVYPAGFVYVFLPLYWITDSGTNILLAQYIFAALYVANLAVVYLIYKRVKTVPLWALVLLSVSKRIHSIYVLRLFNDTFATFFLHVAVLLFLYKRWSIGSLFFSFAVSIKMNVLLYSFGLLVIFLRETGFVGAVKNISICAILQLVLALPFLKENAIGYIACAFNLGRQFMYKWTVNWRFLPEELFTNLYWGLFLLFCNISLWFLFCNFNWVKSGFFSLLCSSKTSKAKPLTPKQIAVILFTSNFIGIYFARTLHYQFYVWFFHSIPLLLWATNIPTLVKLGLFVIMEIVWAIYPSTAMTSLALFACHTTLLVGLWNYNVTKQKEQ